MKKNTTETDLSTKAVFSKSKKQIRIVLRKIFWVGRDTTAFQEVLPEGSARSPFRLCLRGILEMFPRVSLDRQRMVLQISRNPFPRAVKVVLTRITEQWYLEEDGGRHIREFYPENDAAVNRLVHSLGIRSPREGDRLVLWVGLSGKQ